VRQDHAFHRWDKPEPADSAVVVVNMTNKNCDGYVIGFPRVGWWKSFNSSWDHIGIDHNSSINLFAVFDRDIHDSATGIV
jgi:hypothetical protein